MMDYKKIINYIFVLVYLFIYFEYGTHVIMAQENTKQRTTGTYLPVMAASQKKDKIVKPDTENTLELDDGSLKIIVPIDASKSDVRFSIRRVTWKDNSAIPLLKNTDENFVGNDVFEITAVDDKSGLPVLNFDKKLTIIFRYFDFDVENFDESKIEIKYFDRLKQGWISIEAKRDMDSNSLTIESDHLTLFAMTGNTLATGTKNENTTGGENQGYAVWQIILLAIVMLAVTGFGGWYMIKTYLETRKEMEEGKGNIFGENSKKIDENEVIFDSTKDVQAETNKENVFGGQNSNIQKKDESLKNELQSKTQDKDEKEKNKDNEIWIDF